MVTLKHEPGSLYRVLERFYALSINLIKLESRPIPGRDFEFMFYFDLDCPFGSKALDDLLDSIDDVCESFTYSTRSSRGLSTCALSASPRTSRPL